MDKWKVTALSCVGFIIGGIISTYAFDTYTAALAFGQIIGALAMTFVHDLNGAFKND